MRKQKGVLLRVQVDVKCDNCRGATLHYVTFFGSSEGDVFLFQCQECDAVITYDRNVHYQTLPLLVRIEMGQMSEQALPTPVVKSRPLIPIISLCWLVMAAFLYSNGWPVGSEDAMTAGLLMGGLIGAFERRRSKRGQIVLWTTSLIICGLLLYRYDCGHFAVYNFALTSAYLITRFLDWAHPE